MKNNINFLDAMKMLDDASDNGTTLLARPSDNDTWYNEGRCVMLLVTSRGENTYKRWVIGPRAEMKVLRRGRNGRKMYDLKNPQAFIPSTVDLFGHWEVLSMEEYKAEEQDGDVKEDTIGQTAMAA